MLSHLESINFNRNQNIKINKTLISLYISNLDRELPNLHEEFTYISYMKTVINNTNSLQLKDSYSRIKHYKGAILESFLKMYSTLSGPPTNYDSILSGPPTMNPLTVPQQWRDEQVPFHYGPMSALRYCLTLLKFDQNHQVCLFATNL